MESTSAAVPVVRTVVFTDLVGSTQLADRLGDSRLVEVLDHHDRIVAAVTHEWHGELVKSTGDGAMVVFEHADEAVAATIALQRRAITAHIPLRVGADHGAVVRCGADYRGLVANVAARLAGLAGGGEIVLSDRVVTAARFAGGQPRAQQVRGLRTRQRIRTLIVRNGAN